MVEYEDMERAIMCHVAAKLIDALPEEERKKILEASLAKTLKEMLKPWNVEKAIESDVKKYMSEYINQPEVQERIKVATHEAFDKFMNGVINTIVISSQDAIKSSYKKFIERENNR